MLSASCRVALVTVTIVKVSTDLKLSQRNAEREDRIPFK